MIIPTDWKPSDGLTLEPNALLAATDSTHCLALTAGPGAGKTEMLAQRADFLLRTGLCRFPKRILAISFKVDASKNLKQRVQLRCGSILASRFDSYTFHAFAKRIIDRFRPVLKGVDALDLDYTLGSSRIVHRQIEFADLIPLAVQILQDSPVSRNAIRQSYTDVFLDEFQDCTEQQYSFVKIAFQGTKSRFVAVGDTKQKIMGWAGAMEGIFEIFVRDFSAIPLNMYRNFRSLPRILKMQNEIIRCMDPTAAMPDEQISGEGGEVLALRFPDSNSESEYLVDAMERWLTIDKIPPSEIAVLVSKQPDLYARDLMEALSSKRIPYRNEQLMQDISVESLARLIDDYLLCLFGRKEPEAWIRLMTLLVPFEDEEIEISTRQEIDAFLREQRKGIEIVEPVHDWWGKAEAFLVKIGVDRITALSEDYETQSRSSQVINETKVRIEELLSEDWSLIKALARFSDSRAIRILTVHKSKGLEFNSVIFLAIDNEIFFGDLDENWCAFFVGISRAKSRLILTFAERRNRPQGFERRWDVVRTQHSEFWSYASVSSD